MGYKHWNYESLPEFNIEQEMKILEEAKKKAEELKKADKKRVENIKNRWFSHKKLSEEDTTWLIMKVEKSLYKWEG